MSVSEITNLDECKRLWTRRGLPFGDFEFRRKLAEHDGMEPHFLKSGDTVLPIGVHNDTFYFYGGLRYNEHNGFIGSGNERELLRWVSGTKFRLLAWDSDPLEFADEMAYYDVPFNQYWIQRRSFWPHVGSLPKKIEKEINYLLRKYEFRTVKEDYSDTRNLIDEFIDHTIEAFAKRGASCAYEKNRELTLFICDLLHRESNLSVIRVCRKGKTVGLAVLSRGKVNTYLLGLYQKSPSDISNACLVAAMSWGRVDALRGSFTLKKKYGLQPRPSYALVSDSTWVKKKQTDLDESEIRLLYGRGFGEPPWP